MQVLAIRNSSREGPDYVDQVGLPEELHALATRADVVVNALPLTEKSRGIFNQEFFAAAKPGAMFISVGRGQSTVTADLVAALQSGQLHSAGLDVTDPEPLPAESPLWQMNNVLITPHISSTGQGGAELAHFSIRHDWRPGIVHSSRAAGPRSGRRFRPGREVVAVSIARLVQGARAVRRST